MFLGEIISLIVAVSWTATALFAEVASRRAGSLTVNVFRMILSLIFLGITLWITTGQPLPSHTDGETWMWLSLSGFVGYVLGDYCLFNSYLIIGSRWGQLFMTLASPFAALAAWVLLGETLSWTALLGMAVCMTGIGMSVLSRTDPQGSTSRTSSSSSSSSAYRASSASSPSRASSLSSPSSASSASSTSITSKKKISVKLPLKGILLGIGAGAGQGIGLVLSKVGMAHYSEIIPATDTMVQNMVPFASTMMRAVTGLLGFSLAMAYTRQFNKLSIFAHDGKALGAGLGAVILGPFLGVSLSLWAVQIAPAGIAQTLMSLTPIFILLPSRILFKAHITWLEVIGAIIAVAGVSLFFI